MRGELRRNLAALQCALFAAELLDLLTEEYDPHPELFDHFLSFLQDIEEGKAGPDRRDIMIRLILFQFVLLHEVGLQPILELVRQLQETVRSGLARELLQCGGQRAGLPGLRDELSRQDPAQSQGGTRPGRHQANSPKPTRPRSMRSSRS